MNISARLGISRRSDDKICISISDDTSGIEFVLAEVDPYDFAQLITGLHGVKAPCRVKGLDNVGKTKIRERRTTICPDKSYDRKFLEQWLKDNRQEDGWVLDSSLGSQNSTFSSDGGTGLNYAVYRYEDVS